MTQRWAGGAASLGEHGPSEQSLAAQQQNLKMIDFWTWESGCHNLGIEAEGNGRPRTGLQTNLIGPVNPAKTTLHSTIHI